MSPRKEVPPLSCRQASSSQIWRTAILRNQSQENDRRRAAASNPSTLLQLPIPPLSFSECESRGYARPPGLSCLALNGRNRSCSAVGDGCPSSDWMLPARVESRGRAAHLLPPPNPFFTHPAPSSCESPASSGQVQVAMATVRTLPLLSSLLAASCSADLRTLVRSQNPHSSVSLSHPFPPADC